MCVHWVWANSGEITKCKHKQSWTVISNTSVTVPQGYLAWHRYLAQTKQDSEQTPRSWDESGCTERPALISNLGILYWFSWGTQTVLAQTHTAGKAIPNCKHPFSGCRGDWLACGTDDGTDSSTDDSKEGHLHLSTVLKLRRWKDISISPYISSDSHRRWDPNLRWLPHAFLINSLRVIPTMKTTSNPGGADTWARCPLMTWPLESVCLCTVNTCNVLIFSSSFYFRQDQARGNAFLSAAV